MIRQAISCDICGTEKRQTNYWFVAYDHGGELRLSGWNSRNRLHPGSKHLCGQTCLHKLVDDFMTRALAARTLPLVQAKDDSEQQKPATDTSLTSDEAYVVVESSARLLTPPLPISPNRPLLGPTVELVPLPGRLLAAELESSPADEPQNNSTRSWRAEAWKREREREMRAGERVVRRRSNS